MLNHKPELFGTDGIRGIVGQDPLVPGFILNLGLAAGHVMKSSSMHPAIVIGRDTRQSGEMLQSALAAGLLYAGVKVIDVGVIPTPGVAFLTRKLGAQAGAVISASHNPVEQNGVKFFNFDGTKLPENIEYEIEKLASDPEILSKVHSGDFGRLVEGQSLRELYKESLIVEHPGLDLGRLTIVLDCANGAASDYAPDILSRLGAHLVVINASPTGLNINQRAGSEQVRKHPDGLHRIMLQYSADLGLAFDGDADRAVFVDETGTLIDGDHMLAILAGYLSNQGRLLGNAIVSTSMRNQGLVNFAKEKELNFFQTKVGDKFVTEKILSLSEQLNDPGCIGLGGEQAGHIILYDAEHNTGDGIRTGLYVLEALAAADFVPMSSLAGCIIKYPQVIASALVHSKPDLESISGLAEIKENTLEEMPDLLRMELRYSGTEPLFRAMLEGDVSHTEQDLANAAGKMCKAVQTAAGMNGNAIDGIEILNVSKGGELHF